MIQEKRQSQAKEVLLIKTTTDRWNRQCYNYQNKNPSQVHIQKFTQDLLNQFLYIYRHRTTIQTTVRVSNKLEYLHLEGFQVLLAAELHYESQEDKFFLRFYHGWQVEQTQTSFKDQFPSNKEEVHLVVRSLKDRNGHHSGYQLKPGTEFKIGKISYRLISAGQALVPSTQDRPYQVQPQEEPSSTECKYCLMKETDAPEDFITSPCECKGSCGSVHFSCLQTWSKTKVISKNKNNLTTKYQVRKLHCQICKKKYPLFFEKKGQVYELCGLQKHREGNIVLEHSSEKGVFTVIQKGTMPITFGRAYESVIRGDDLSVSRDHAKIEQFGDDLFIFDCKSCYGTLVKEEKLTIELTGRRKTIQVGRTLIFFKIGEKQMTSDFN